MRKIGEKDEKWITVILEAESHSSAIKGVRSRSSHDTCFWPYPPYSHEYGLSSSIIVAIACGGRVWPACTIPWNTTSNHTEAESSMQLGNKRKQKHRQYRKCILEWITAFVVFTRTQVQTLLHSASGIWAEWVWNKMGTSNCKQYIINKPHKCISIT